MQKEIIIKTKDLFKTYGSGEAAVQALKPCNIAVSAGEKIAVVGASGSGKSTLLHLLGGLDRPTGGSILFHGEDLYSKKDAALAKFRRQNVGFVFQSYNLVPELTAEENIRLNGHGIPIANVILTGMLPATIGGILLVTLISLLSCLSPCGWVMKQSITGAIDSVRY